MEDGQTVEKDKLACKIQRYIHVNPELEHLQLHKDTMVNFLAQGEYNINFTLDSAKDKYVFRVNTGSQLEIDNQIMYEYQSIKRLEQTGVTPKVYYVDDTRTFFDYGILIMEFLEGKPLNYGMDLSKAANIFANIHSLHIDEPHHFIVEENLFSDRIREGERLLTKVWDSPIVHTEIKLFLEKIVDWTKLNKTRETYFLNEPWHVVNNTEVNSHNFIIGKEHSYLIDWEKPVIGDPAQDITQFMAPTTTLWKTNDIMSAHEKEDFFNLYVNGLNGKDKNIRERVNLYTPYLYLRALAWCAYAYVEYHDPNKTIKNMDTFEKIKEFLQIDFMQKLYAPYW